jgi:hypothetical protein
VPLARQFSRHQREQITGCQPVTVTVPGVQHVCIGSCRPWAALQQLHLKRCCQCSSLCPICGGTLRSFHALLHACSTLSAAVCWACSCGVQHMQIPGCGYRGCIGVGGEAVEQPRVCGVTAGVWERQQTARCLGAAVWSQSCNCDSPCLAAAVCSQNRNCDSPVSGSGSGQLTLVDLISVLPSRQNLLRVRDSSSNLQPAEGVVDGLGDICTAT